ncbi:MAG TPA: hypothetical protein VL361_19445 [Candidatus Limnocylindrales bacterium]|jgi:hypothetical protein|nr:hypothetical protein [Candidatus Limnocylindrales bacterium]
MDIADQLRLARKSAAEQKLLISELNSLLKDIERCERLIQDLKTELEKINTQHRGPRTTREDIAYLTDLLACAKKKLNWEKQLASLQKRTPLALERLANLLHDPKNPPNEETRTAMLRVLQQIQATMERLQAAAG